MDPDLVFIVNYACPRCQAALEARVGGVARWLRCPECGRAGLPPEHNRATPSWSVDKTLIVDSFLSGGASGSASVANPYQYRPMGPLPPPRPTRKAPPAKVILGSLSFLSTVISLISLLEAGRERAAIFGLAAVVCLVMLVRQQPRGPLAD